MATVQMLPRQGRLEAVGTSQVGGFKERRMLKVVREEWPGQRLLRTGKAGGCEDREGLEAAMGK